MAAIILGRLMGEGCQDVLEGLTARERGIVFWVVAGLCLADVGDVLGISASNVKFRLSLIREKLGVRDETQMVVYVLTGYRRDGD